MSLLREYIRILLKEDPMGFVHDLAASSEEFGEPGEMFFGGDPGKSGGKAIKRAFNANADHKWLSTLNTVHYGDVYGLEDLMGKNKDELSTYMTLPGDDFRASDRIGLWVKGRITLAGVDMDQLYTGHHDDYVGPKAPGTPEEQEHRSKSSGVNKRPTVSKDYSRYGKLKRGNEYAEKMARNIPYVLDQSMWSSVESGGEALVDNWKAVGIIAEWESTKIITKMKKDREIEYEDYFRMSAGKIKQLFRLAEKFGVPIFDRNGNEIWSPE